MRTIIFALALLAFSLPASSSDPSSSQSGDVAFLGVGHRAPQPQTIDNNGLNAHQGVEIINVHSDSSAERMGIKEGDVILELNGVPIRNGSDLRTEITRNIEGDPVSALIRRNGQDIELNDNFGATGNFKRQALDSDADAQYRAEQEQRLKQQQQELQELRDELKEIEKNEKELNNEEQAQPIEKEVKSEDPYTQRINLVQSNGNWHLIYVIDSTAN
jgi:membrane-associated protease RseP (regulator of RpoE activity)